MPVDPKLQAESPWLSILHPALNDRRLRPVFSARKANTSVSIYSRNSVVFDNIGETDDIKPFKPKMPGHRLIVIMTARQMAADGGGWQRN